MPRAVRKAVLRESLRANEAALLLVLRQKFPAPIPADLVAAIEAQADVDVLSQWLTTAVVAGSLEAFRTAIRA